MHDELIARKDSSERVQTLYCHTRNVAEISADLSNYPNTSKLIAYLHDLGKASTAFQKYIKDGGKRGSVIHAFQGAFLAYEFFTDNSKTAQILKETLGFCIVSHHNHLENGASPDGTTNHFDKYLNTADIKYSLNEIREKFTKEDIAKLESLFDKAVLEMERLLYEIIKSYKNKNSANFALGLFIKYLFSCLVDADRFDAHLFSVNEAYYKKDVNWDTLINKFEKNISRFPNSSKIDAIRKSVSEKCKIASEKETGVYQLSVPTGGGKTLSSLRFALHHCKKHGKKRIIYVIPYLSIIEQTAKSLRDILDLAEENEEIFENHSNIMEPEDEKSSEIRKLSAARWDSPIILTTMVQFMETVMSSRSGVLRKFRSMADSVIIFDEIQSMPTKAIHCFNEVATFLSKILNSTILLCSATQPTLEATQRTNLLLEKNAHLIDCTDDFKDIKRAYVVVEREKNCEGASAFIAEKAALNGNCLAIVNTRNCALEIYRKIKSITKDFEVVHLSTSMCPIDRSRAIDIIKACLKDKKKVICVSTQLIEAGVDISFSCVVRAMAGLDSIAQAAGRCNRNGESALPKAVYTFSLKDENLEKLKDIKSGKEIAEQIIRGKADGSDLLDEPVITAYYKQYFNVRKDQMDYPLANEESIYGMLSGNEVGKQNYKNRTGNLFTHYIAHAFYWADIKFSMIDKNTKSVVVMCCESKKLFEEYQKLPAQVYTKEKAKILRKLQKYSVSLYEWQLKKLVEERAIFMLDNETEVLFLDKDYYSDETGVTLESIQKNYII